MNLRTDDKKKIEHVAFVIDESGSMMSTRKETLDGINEQIQEPRKTEEIDTYVSIVKFSSTVEYVLWNVPLAEVQDLTQEDYLPSGMTAMLDAVGETIGRLRLIEVDKDDDVSYLLIIVSDGCENSSREYSWSQVKDLVTACNEDKKWTITYMGANQDLSQVRENMNLKADNMTMYCATGGGTSDAFRKMSGKMASYRSIRSTTDARYASSVGFYNSTGETTPVGDTDAKPEEV